MSWFSLGLQDGSGFEKRLHPISAVFAADAGVFESAPGRLRIVRHAVDHDAAGPNLRGYAARTPHVVIPLD
jgi:hypothetical protein